PFPARRSSGLHRPVHPHLEVDVDDRPASVQVVLYRPQGEPGLARLRLSDDRLNLPLVDDWNPVRSSYQLSFGYGPGTRQYKGQVFVKHSWCSNSCAQIVELKYRS